jgi:hypothetical protein
MPLSQIEQWLHEAGYEYHCFVSYPRIKTRDGSVDSEHPINVCAGQVRDALERCLSFSIPNPQVFLDVGMGGGVDWERTLRRALCRSLVMVPICSDIYFHPSHSWCGMEWAAMDALGDCRLQGSNLRPIFPLMIKRDKALPPVAARVPQWGDVSGAALSRRYYSTKAFSQCIHGVVAHIERVAEALCERDIRSGCEQFAFPQTSAFVDWQSSRQEFPLTGGR